MFALGLSPVRAVAGQCRRWAGAPARCCSGDGVRGDFFTGVLAVVVATPCTAPFMGAALAYAFTGPTAGALLVFLMLGLGLALPFLLIGFVPAFAAPAAEARARGWRPSSSCWRSRCTSPRPGWCGCWPSSAGPMRPGWWLAAAIAAGAGRWAWARARSGAARGWQALALLALLAVGWPLARLHALPRPQATAVAAPAGIASVAWSEQALADLRGAGPAGVRQHDRRLVRDLQGQREDRASPARRFRDALEAANAVYMVGDYTDVDPAITAYLQRHRAVGVPLYVVYPRGGGEGRILPTLLTAGMVEDALREAAR